MEDDRDWVPKPFRFFNAWASHPNFLRVVKEAWSICALQGWAGYKVSLKFKEVKASLKQWNKEEFGNLNDKLSLIEDQLHFIDLLQERNALSDNDMQIKRILKSEYWKILRLIKITWLQKSRQIWFKEGDKNSKIFHMVAIGTNVDFTSQVAEYLNCSVDKLPINYLGMPLGANPKRAATWELIIKNVKKRLSSWKRRYLSLRGRITLVKSVLSSLPLYYMSLFRIPSTVANTIDKFQRSFLWGDSEEKKKLHLVSWKDCSLSRKFGGLGFRKSRDNSESLLYKWWWRFAKELTLYGRKSYVLKTI
ncbi:hypothetical protein ACSBR1_006087 [Camellia fascicularis]